MLPTRLTAGALTRIARVLAPIALWLMLVSGALSEPTHAGLRLAKDEGGKPIDAPRESRFVQVREHWVAGFRVTEVVLGRTHVDAELPLIVSFHGRASAPRIPDGDHTNTPPHRLMLPWAPERLGDGRTWFPVSITEDEYPDKVLGDAIQRRVEQMSHVLKQFRARRPTEGLPLVSGFSQGGMLTFGLAVLRPETIDGAFPMAGWLPSYLARQYVDPMRAYPPIRALNGDGDPVVPVEGTRELVDQLRDLGIDAHLDVFETDRHQMSSEAWVLYKRYVREAIEQRRRVIPNWG